MAILTRKNRQFVVQVEDWLTHLLGVGPALGNIFYMAPTGGTMEGNLLANGVPDAAIYHTLVSAEAAMTTDQNDVLLVTPGLYTETATCDWTKDHTHLVGLGGPNILGRFGRPNCMIYTETAGVNYTVHLTGDFCQFHNIMLGNGGGGATAGATANNLSAMYLVGYGNYFKRVAFRGIGSTAQLGAAACSSLEIGAAGECEFDECIIGQNGFGSTRTIATQGHMRLSYAADDAGMVSPQNMVFKNTMFLSRSETITTPMVYWTNLYASDRMWMFDNCHFENFSVNGSLEGLCEVVFKKDTGTNRTTNVSLRNCSARGYNLWIGSAQNPGYYQPMFQSNSPLTGTGGGLMRAPTTDADGT